MQQLQCKVNLCTKTNYTDDHCALAAKSPIGRRSHVPAVLSVSPGAPWAIFPLLIPQKLPCGPAMVVRLSPGRTETWEGNTAVGQAVSLPPIAYPSVPFSEAQSFLALLAFAIFSWRFCFFFCSLSRASIILASFHDNSALAMKRGVRANMTVVRKP